MTGRRSPRRSALLGAALAGAVLTGVAVGAAARFTDGAPARDAVQASELHGQATWPAGERLASPFSLRDQSGRRVSLASLRGRVVLLTFLDSRCVDICPVAGQFLADVESLLTVAEKPLLVVVGLNPSGDTPASVRLTARRWGWRPGWRWLSGSRRELERVWRAYGISVRPLAGAIAHDAAVYLVDRSGSLRAGYLVPFSPPILARDVERITLA